MAGQESAGREDGRPVERGVGDCRPGERGAGMVGQVSGEMIGQVSGLRGDGSPGEREAG